MTCYHKTWLQAGVQGYLHSIRSVFIHFPLPTFQYIAVGQAVVFRLSMETISTAVSGDISPLARATSAPGL